MSERKGMNFWEFCLAFLAALDWFGLVFLLLIACSIGQYMIEVMQEGDREQRIESCITAGHAPSECATVYRSPE